MFTQALRKELREICLKEGAILQCGDTLICNPPLMEVSDRNNIEILNLGETQGYRISKKKAQISKQQVKYMGNIIKPGSRQLFPDRKQTILSLGTPRIKRHLWASQVVLVVRNPPARAGDIRDLCSIPDLRRSPGGGHGNPLQCSCLEHLMDRGHWRATVH